MPPRVFYQRIFFTETLRWSVHLLIERFPSNERHVMLIHGYMLYIFFQQYSLRPATLLKKRLWQRYFPVNLAEFLRIPFYRTPLVAASFFCIQACIFSFYKTLALIRQSVLNFLFWFHFVHSWDHISHIFIFYEYTDT